MAELDATMSAEEWQDWGAYYEEEPWGCPTEDHRMGTLCSLIYSAHSTSGTTIPHFFDRRPDETAARLAKQVISDAEIERMFDAAIARQNAHGHVQNK